MVSLIFVNKFGMEHLATPHYAKKLAQGHAIFKYFSETDSLIFVNEAGMEHLATSHYAKKLAQRNAFHEYFLGDG